MDQPQSEYRGTRSPKVPTGQKCQASVQAIRGGAAIDGSVSVEFFKYYGASVKIKCKEIDKKIEAFSRGDFMFLLQLAIPAANLI
jgi:hypothetical protein